MKVTGGCLCGRVRYEADGKPLNSRICHCRVCQRAIGASFNARILFRQADVRVHGPISWFNSSPDLERGFCGQCGTTLFSARASRGVMGVTVGSLDDPLVFQPDMHFWVSSKQPWVVLTDGLPQYPEGAPAV